MISETYPLLISDDEVHSERQLLKEFEPGPRMESIDSVRYLILHCSATRANQDYTVRQLERDHRARGFRTVGYHFYIRRSGEVSQLRRLSEVGAHCRPYNRCSLGICYEGGLDAAGRPADTRTPQQCQALQQLLLRLLRLFPQARIMGHRDMPGATPKSCPCFDAGQEYGWIAS